LSKISVLAVLVLVTTAAFFAPIEGTQNPSTLSGILNIILSDSEKGGSCQVYYLYTSSGEYVQIYLAEPVPLSYSKREVVVTGTIVQLTDRTTMNATAIAVVGEARVSAVVSGTRRIAMLLLKYSDSAAYTPNDAAYYSNLMNPTTNSVNAFYREESYGLLSVQADVYGWYTLPRPRSYYVYGSLTTCGVYFNRLVNDGVVVADPYVYFPQYDDVSFVMNDYLDCCAWGGSYVITADGVPKLYGATWEPPWAQNIGVYAHEIGHSIGCPHTGFVGGNTYDSVWDVESGGTNFNSVLRGSYYSVAAGQTKNLYSRNPCHHIAYHKIKLGWLDGYYSEVAAGTATTLTLNALAGARTSVMAAKVRIPGQDPSKRYLTVEARTKINYDQWLPGEGIIIHSVDEDRVVSGLDSSENVPAYPIDSTPGTSTLDDAQWAVGTTYNNAAYGLSISAISKTSNSYQVGIANGASYITITTTTTTMSTTTSTLTSYGSTSIVSSQRSTTTTKSTVPTTTLYFTSTMLSGSISTNSTLRVTLSSASSSLLTATVASSGTSTFTSTELSKTGTITIARSSTNLTTVGSTVYVKIMVQRTLVEQFLNKIVTTFLQWFSELAKVTQNIFPPGTVADVNVKVEPGLGSTLGSMFAGSDPVGFMLTGNIYDDSGMLGIYAHRSQPKLLFSKTDMSRVSPTGQPTWLDHAHLITVGGRAANPTTKYYEDSGLAPLKYVGTATDAIIARGSDVKLNVPLSSISQSNDYFVMQVLSDGAHKIVILWGIAHWGTYASGVYFDGKYPDIASLTYGWYIVRWQDLNGNLIPDYPGEFTVVASGT